MNERRLIHIVDDEESIRKSASFMLRTSGFDVKTHATGVAFLKEARHLDPGCVLLDIRMPEMDGLQVQAAMNAQGIAMPVVVLTGHGDISIAVQAMKGGAVDFIEKPFEKARLLQAIQTACEKMRRGEAATVSAQDAAVRIAALTAREQDVLHGLARGHPNKTIAHDLGISPRTVEVHRANLMTKLDVRSLSEALRLAFVAGMDQ